MTPTDMEDDADHAQALKVLGRDRAGNARPERAQQKLDALRQWADEQAPDEATYDRVWARLEASAAAPENRHGAAHALTASEAPWWQRWFSGQPLGIALASLMLVVGAAVLWQGVFAPEDDFSGSKGASQRIGVRDLQAGTPALVAELKSLGLAPRLERRDGELAMTVQLPEKIPESLQRWATRWGVTAQPGEVLRVVLFHRPQAVAPPAGEAPAPPSK